MTDYVSEPLGEWDETSGFDCGIEALNRWFSEHAWRAQKQGTARTTVWRVHDDHRIVAFYSVAPSVIARDQLTTKFHGRVSSVPGYMLAKLALDTSFHGRRLGEQLLLDALETICTAAERGGGRLIVVDPINENAKGFYAHYGFEAVGESDRMYMLMKDARMSLGLAIED
jgi:ribosomal protein S18 acetylase RimI-like enzyme